jgi:signal peptidase
MSLAPPMSVEALWRPIPISVRRRRRLQRVARRAFAAARVLLAVMLFAGWFVLLRPTTLGGPASYVLVTGCSMCPTYSPGDLIVTTHHDSYSVGQIVAYRVPAPDPAAGHIVIHRIVGVSKDGYTMRGDHNSWPDPWHPTAHDVVGTAWLRVPGAGGVLQQVRSPALLAALGATVAFCVIAFGAKRPE